MRRAAIDYGEARIGVALSDERGIIATPLGFIKTEKSLEKCAHALITYLKPYFPLHTLVIGYPLLLNGKEGIMAQQCKRLAEILQTMHQMPVILWDERLSTAEVERTLKEAKLSRKQRAPVIDACCAAAILQNYLQKL